MTSNEVQKAFAIDKSHLPTRPALYDDPDVYVPTGHQLKAWLFGGQSIKAEHALFDVEASTAALRIVGLALLLAPVGELLLAAVEGSGDTRGTLRIELFVGLFVLSLAALTGLVLDRPLVVVWMFAPVEWALRGLLGLVRLRSEAWRSAEV